MEEGSSMADMSKKEFFKVLDIKDDLTGISMEVIKPHNWSRAKYEVLAVFRTKTDIPDYYATHKCRKQGFVLLAGTTNQKACHQKVLKYRKWYKEHHEKSKGYKLRSSA
jgi:hypothetical protein